MNSFLKYLLLVILCSGSLAGQNLVKNPSFEEYDNCPSQMGNFHNDVVSWSIPTLGSTDYFNECSSIMGAPKNFNGNQTADFGSGYAGLYLLAPDNYREYIQAELKERLRANEKYEVSFYLNWADESDVAVNHLGILFSEQALHFNIKGVLSAKIRSQQKNNHYNFHELKSGSFYGDRHDWQKLSLTFTARGGEKYLVLGNFKNNAATRHVSNKAKIQKGAYYYIDLVSVRAVNPIKIKAPTLNQNIIVENINFEFDEFTLSAEAQSYLKEFYKTLPQGADWMLEIHGHTDNQGKKKYNQKLSEKRAAAVAQFLINLGWPPHSIKWLGHGDKEPLVIGQSPQERLQNRRVEFVLRKRQ